MGNFSLLQAGSKHIKQGADFSVKKNPFFLKLIFRVI